MFYGFLKQLPGDKLQLVTAWKPLLPVSADRHHCHPMIGCGIQRSLPDGSMTFGSGGPNLSRQDSPRVSPSDFLKWFPCTDWRCKPRDSNEIQMFSNRFDRNQMWCTVLALAENVPDFAIQSRGGLRAQLTIASLHRFSKIRSARFTNSSDRRENRKNRLRCHREFRGPYQRLERFKV